MLRERLHGSCSVDAVMESILAGVHRVRRRLAFRSVVETHECLVDVEQNSVGWINLHVAVSLCVWPLTSPPCCVLCFLSTRNRVPYRCNPILRWHVSRKLNVSGGMLCIAPRGWSCRVELHSIARYCLLQAWRKPPGLCLFFCVCVWMASPDQRLRTVYRYALLNDGDTFWEMRR